MADTSYNTQGVYEKQGGTELIVANGGTVTVESGGIVNVASGGQLQFAGSDRAAVLSTAPAAVAAGYKIARGEVTLDGSNPSSATTGLATVVAATASLKQSTAPGDDPSWLSVDYGGGVTAGQLDIYAWKNTGGTDPTLVASTNNSAVVSWIAIGT